MEDRERVFRRAVAISAAGHVRPLIGWRVSPVPRSRSTCMPGSMSVGLVAAPPLASAKPAAKPAAKPKPKPPEVKPPPPKPEVKVDKKVLPKDPMKQPKKP